MTPPLLPIGRFAELARLSIKALRHYDDLGLLKPAQVDPNTGYRYYALAQAAVAERIKLLRELEVPLAQIHALVEERDPARIAAQLEAHRAALAARLAETQDRLLTLEGLIAELQSGEGEFALRKLPEVPVLAARTVLTPEEQSVAGFHTFSALYGALEGRWDALLGPPFSIRHDPAMDDERIDVEWCVPIADAPRLEGLGGPRLVAGGQHAIAVHHGPAVTLGPTYRALQRWMDGQGLEALGPAREIYVKNPGTTPNPRERLTELCWPV